MSLYISPPVTSTVLVPGVPHLARHEISTEVLGTTGSSTSYWYRSFSTGGARQVAIRTCSKFYYSYLYPSPGTSTVALARDVVFREITEKIKRDIFTIPVSSVRTTGLGCPPDATTKITTPCTHFLEDICVLYNSTCNESKKTSTTRGVQV